MNIYEDEVLETVLKEITDSMGYLILDIIKVSLKKIRTETAIFDELTEVALEVKSESSPEL